MKEGGSNLSLSIVAFASHYIIGNTCGAVLRCSYVLLRAPGSDELPLARLIESF